MNKNKVGAIICMVLLLGVTYVHFTIENHMWKPATFVAAVFFYALGMAFVDMENKEHEDG